MQNLATVHIPFSRILNEIHYLISRLSNTFRCMTIFARGNKRYVFDVVRVGFSRLFQVQGETFSIDLFEDYVWKKARLQRPLKFMPRKSVVECRWILLLQATGYRLQHTVVPFTDVKKATFCWGRGEKKSVSGLAKLPFRSQRLPTDRQCKVTR